MSIKSRIESWLEENPKTIFSGASLTIALNESGDEVSREAVQTQIGYMVGTRITVIDEARPKTYQAKVCSNLQNLFYQIPELNTNTRGILGVTVHNENGKQVRV